VVGHNQKKGEEERERHPPGRNITFEGYKLVCEKDWIVKFDGKGLGEKERRHLRH